VKPVEVRFRLNGEPVAETVPPGLRLVDLLRDRLGLTGTKIGCEEGECGACTVVVDGKAVNSCLVLAAEVDSCDVITIEGLQANGDLHPIHRAFVEAGAVQCGFCTPGMIMRTYAFLQECPDPTEDEIRRSIEGNLCRCTGYVKILEAIRRLVQERALEALPAKERRP
jgi:carbon-monoxide dehydrogenase small subunit